MQMLWYPCIQSGAGRSESASCAQVLEAIFESPHFRLHDLGGDYVLPGCVQYQRLHQDLGDFLRDPAGRLDFRDLPTPEVRRLAAALAPPVHPATAAEVATWYSSCSCCCYRRPRASTPVAQTS